MLSVIFNFLINLPKVIFYYNKDKVFEKKHRRIRLYGIYGFFGLPGKGKTISLAYRLKQLRKAYGNDIYICTNFCYKYEDFSFCSWKQLLQQYDKPLIVAWDEVQNEFSSRDFLNFPIALLTQLTQVRKGNGIQILYSSQRWHFVDKAFRSLTFGCYDCFTILGRFTGAKLYDTVDYDELQSSSTVDKKMKVHCKSSFSFFQSDELRDSYDSFKMLQTAKSKKYATRAEVNSSKSE